MQQPEKLGRRKKFIHITCSHQQKGGGCQLGNLELPFRNCWPYDRKTQSHRQVGGAGDFTKFPELGSFTRFLILELFSVSLAVSAFAHDPKIERWCDGSNHYGGAVRPRRHDHFILFVLHGRQQTLRHVTRRHPRRDRSVHR